MYNFQNNRREMEEKMRHDKKKAVLKICDEMTHQLEEVTSRKTEIEQKLKEEQAKERAVLEERVKMLEEIERKKHADKRSKARDLVMGDRIEKELLK